MTITIKNMIEVTQIIKNHNSSQFIAINQMNTILLHSFDHLTLSSSYLHLLIS